jgi:hypothetical protein
MYQILDTPIIRYDWDGTSTLGTTWWEGPSIWAAFSLDGGQTWSLPVEISGMHTNNKQPDLAIAPTMNWHFTFSSQNDSTGVWELHYRRGHMELK